MEKDAVGMDGMIDRRATTFSFLKSAASGTCFLGERTQTGRAPPGDRKGLKFPAQISCTYNDHRLGSGTPEFPWDSAKPLAVHPQVSLGWWLSGTAKLRIVFQDAEASCHGEPPLPRALVKVGGSSGSCLWSLCCYHPALAGTPLPHLLLFRPGSQDRGGEKQRKKPSNLRVKTQFSGFASYHLPIIDLSA